MESYIISVIVKYLLSKGLEYLDLPLAEIKKECIEYIKDSIDPQWLEDIALDAFDSVWGIIIGKVKEGLEGLPGNILGVNDQEELKIRSGVTAKVVKSMA